MLLLEGCGWSIAFKFVLKRDGDVAFLVAIDIGRVNELGMLSDRVFVGVVLSVHRSNLPALFDAKETNDAQYYNDE